MKRIIILIIAVVALTPAKTFSQAELVSQNVVFNRVCGDSIISWEARVNYVEPVDGVVDVYFTFTNTTTGETINAGGVGAHGGVEVGKVQEEWTQTFKNGFDPNQSYKLLMTIKVGSNICYQVEYFVPRSECL